MTMTSSAKVQLFLTASPPEQSRTKEDTADICNLSADGAEKVAALATASRSKHKSYEEASQANSAHPTSNSSSFTQEVPQEFTHEVTGNVASAVTSLIPHLLHLG